MFTRVSVEVPSLTLLRLVEQLQRRGGTQDLSQGVSQAIEWWLDEQNKLPPGASPDGRRGYQWKCLFLPEGTELRSWSYGEHNYAKVIGDQIIHQGRSVSPNQFARAFARTNRNAWEDLSVRLPGEKTFKQAGILRKEARQEDELRKRTRLEASQTTSVIALSVPAPAPVPDPERCIGSFGNAALSPPPASQPRDPTPGEGWTLPERRKYRFRLEDVAFD